MGGKSSPAPAPDYTGAAQQTAAGNMENLKYQTAANRPDQVTPWGTSTWSQNGDKWTQKVTLSPSEQQALDSQMAIQQGQSSLAHDLQKQAAITMANGLNAPSLSDYTRSVPGVNTSFSGFNGSGVGQVNQQGYNPMSFTRGNQQVDQNFRTMSSPLAANSQDYTAGAGNVNLDTPQFSGANRQGAIDAAYKASTGVVQGQWDQQNKGLDESLRLQGLTPGSEAYNNAMKNQLTTQDQTRAQMANQAVITGDNVANNDYASALSGYTSGLGAQNQAFSQGTSTFNNNNAANNQQYANDMSAFGANNAARTQQLNNGLSQYGATLQGQQAQNTAQGQSYAQALGNYTTSQQAQLASNQAQAQSYSQALGGYQAAYQSALQNYLQPLNSMNAVLTGQQVANPTFNSFATAGYTPGTDYTGAANSLAGYNQGATNSANASSASTTSALIGVAGTAAMLF